MNDYIGETRIRGRNLLIVEGKHEKQELFWLIFQCFPEIGMDMENVWIYGNNIYVLYDDIVEAYGAEWTGDDIDLPFIISKKQGMDRIQYKEDFRNIILVFDYERHDTNFSEAKILDMQNYFMDAADNGKLYLNYPMIESYQHLLRLPDPDYADRAVPVSMQPGAEYKKLVREESGIAKYVMFPHKVKQLLKEYFGTNEEQAWETCYDTILNLSDANGMDEKMQELFQEVMEDPRWKTAKYHFLHLVSQMGYAENGKTFWQYMREIFQQIVIHNICKAHRIQNSQYQIEKADLKNYFEEIDFAEILAKQNESSRDNAQGFIWVLNTCILFVAEYNFDMVFRQMGFPEKSLDFLSVTS